MYVSGGVGWADKHHQNCPKFSRNANLGEIRWLYLQYGFNSHLLDPRSRRELAFDMPVDGENAMGEEKPERGSAASIVRGSQLKILCLTNSR